MKRDNSIVVDLNKVQWVKFYWRNQHGQCVVLRPRVTTWHNEVIEESELAVYLADFPGETIGNRLKRRGEESDSWTPEIALKLTAHEILIYTGNKAIAINDAWKAKIYGNPTGSKSRAKSKSPGKHSRPKFK